MALSFHDNKSGDAHQALFALGHTAFVTMTMQRDNKWNAKQYLNRGLVWIDMWQQMSEKLYDKPAISSTRSWRLGGEASI